MPFMDEDEPELRGTRLSEVSWLVDRNLGVSGLRMVLSRKTTGTRDMDSE